jgi:hypothetical protein
VKDGDVDDQSLELEEEFKDDPRQRPANHPRQDNGAGTPPDRPTRRPRPRNKRNGTQWTPANCHLVAAAPDDNILVARRDIAAGERVEIDGRKLRHARPSSSATNSARRALAADTRVLKYGAPIGSMKIAVARGEHVHLHNLRSDYMPSTHATGRRTERTLMNAGETTLLKGYARQDGRKGIRNVVAVAYLVECAHHVSRLIVQKSGADDVHLIGFPAAIPTSIRSR